MGRIGATVVGVHGLTWTSYGAFVGFAVLVCLAPGPDFAVVAKNSLAGGRLAGVLTAVGVSLGSAVQGTVAAFGLGAVIVASRPLFETIRWVGVAYLCFLAVQALRSAFRRQLPALDVDEHEGPARRPLVRVTQGAMTNLTNPKILVFYLAVLPQFLGPGASVVEALALANTLPVIGTAWLLVVVSVLHLARGWMLRPRVRRVFDGATGLAMFGFAGRLAVDAR